MKRTCFSILSLLAILAFAFTPVLAGGSTTYLPVVNQGNHSGGDHPTVQATHFLGGTTVDLILRTEGSSAALADHIRLSGGQVKFQYQNVPIVAARISLDQWASVTGFPGVVQVEKDSPVQLAFENRGSRPLSYPITQSAGETLVALQAASPADLPQGYDNFMLSGANLTWEETGAGQGSIVAIVDTGTTPNICLQHAVTGAPGYPDGFNSSGDGIPATSPLNEPHGTWVGGVVASLCQLTLDPASELYQAINKYLDYGTEVPILGQAPLAQIYPVKVIAADGSGSTSTILAGLDHVLSLKRGGLLDIDVVNMSLGQPALYEGRDAFAAFVSALTDAGILVVSAAANSGPTPNSIASPGAADDGICAGGLDYALPSRIFYEWLGLTFLGTPGQGEVLRPTAETRVVNFSSRGPLSDGRMGPDLTALAIWNFQANPDNWLDWLAGTSFATPTIAGGAALLNAYLEGQGQETDPRLLKNVLLAGADATAVGPAWQAHNDQGFGVLDLPAALDVLKYAPQTIVPLPQGGNLKANVFQQPVKGNTDFYETEVITLNASEKVDFILEVNQYTSKVSFDVSEISTPDNSAYAYWPNWLEVNLQSAQRSATDRPVQGWYWNPNWYGDSFNLSVEDGPWTLDGEQVAYRPMEPGLMKFTLAGDFSNESPVSFKLQITRENFRQALKQPTTKGLIRQNDWVEIPLQIPAGATRVQFDLSWLRDWSLFPTSDIDMYVVDPNGEIASFAGLSLNAPERAVIDAPMPGAWTVYLYGYELYRPDTYNVYVKIE